MVVKGDTPDRILFVRDGRRHAPGPLEPGRYTIMASFDGMDLTPKGSVDVEAGQTAEITCDRYFSTCE